MQNLALTSQFSNSGRRGNSSSNSFNSIVLNGVLPPNEDGSVEGIEGVKFPPKKKGKKIIDASSKPWGYEFWYDPHDPRNFTKERLKELNKVDNENYGKYSEPDYPWGRDNWPGPSLGERLMEELERKKNQPETEEEKERRLYGYQLYDRLRNLFKPIPHQWYLDRSAEIVDEWISGMGEEFFDEYERARFHETFYLLLVDLLSGNSSGWYFEEMLKFIKDKEANINKEYSFMPFMREVFNPPIKLNWKDDKGNIRQIESVGFKVVVKFVNGKAVIFIYALIKHSNFAESPILLIEQPIEF